MKSLRWYDKLQRIDFQNGAILDDIRETFKERDAYQNRCEALEKMLVCYRLGRHPSEALLSLMDRTKEAVDNCEVKS